MRAIRIAVLLGVLGASFGAFAQQEIVVDYRISLIEGGVPVPGGLVSYTPVVEANWWTTTLGSFVVKVTLPPGVELVTRCMDGTTTFDAATRVVTWAASFDNQYLAQMTCPTMYRVDPALGPGSVYSLRATLTTEKSDPNPDNNAASLTSVVFASSDLVVTGSADVHRLRPGDTFTYTFRVTNQGPQDAQGVMVSNQLSPHVTFLSLEQIDGPGALLGRPTNDSFVTARIPLLPVGGTATFRVGVRATPTAEAADIVNRVEATSSSYDPADRNDELLVLTHVGPRADLAVTTRRAPFGTELRIPLTIHVSNNGPDAVQNVTVQSSLGSTVARYDFINHAKYVSATPSQGTCSAPRRREQYVNHYPQPYWGLDCALGALAPGGRATITIVFELTGLAGPFRHTAAVGPGQNDPNPANNVSSTDPSSMRRRMVRR